MSVIPISVVLPLCYLLALQKTSNSTCKSQKKPQQIMIRISSVLGSRKPNKKQNKKNHKKRVKKGKRLETHSNEECIYQTQKGTDYFDGVCSRRID